MSKSAEESHYSLEFEGKPNFSGPAFIVNRVVLRKFNQVDDRFIQMEAIADQIAPWRTSAITRLMRPHEVEEFWKNYDVGNFLGGPADGPIVHVDRRRYIE